MSATRPSGDRLKVLHVGKFYPPYRGGMETHLSALAGELVDEVDLDVLVANDARDTRQDVVDGIPVVRAGTVATIASTPISPGFLGFLRRGSWDIIHIHHPHPWAVLAYLLARPKGQLVVTYHSDIVRQRFLGALFNPLLHRFLRGAAAIICTSPDYIESSPILAGHRDRCHVVPFSIDQRAFADIDHEGVRRIRQQHGPRIVLAVGRLIYYKGFAHLIDAMTAVDGHLIIIGEGPLGDSLRAQARARGIADRVSFVGNVESTVPYYHAADVFVLPSIARSEAFGLVQLEAMAAGRPVVNTRLASGVPFVSPHGVTGLTVPPGDSRSLANAITTLLDDPKRAHSMGEAARSRAATDFSLERMRQRTIELYRAVLGKTPRTAPGKEEGAAHRSRPGGSVTPPRPGNDGA